MAGGISAEATLAAVGDLSYVVWLLVVCGSLIVLSLGVFILISYLRRRMLEDDRYDGPVFTHEGLEELRRSGQLTDEEYRKLRRRILNIAPDEPGGSVSSNPSLGDDGQTDARKSSDNRNEEQ